MSWLMARKAQCLAGRARADAWRGTMQGGRCDHAVVEKVERFQNSRALLVRGRCNVDVNGGRFLLQACFEIRGQGLRQATEPLAMRLIDGGEGRKVADGIPGPGREIV